MDEAISDPSAVEVFLNIDLFIITSVQSSLEKQKKVREQMARRAQAHLEHNQSRKLSKQQKRGKMRKKLQENTTSKSFVTIFSTPDLSSKQVRFKIDANANQSVDSSFQGLNTKFIIYDRYNMTGIGIICDVCNVVVLEGGPKGTKKMKGILQRRVKWQNTEEPSGAHDEVSLDQLLR